MAVHVFLHRFMKNVLNFMRNPKLAILFFHLCVIS